MEAFFLLKAQMEQLSTSQRACSVSMEQTTSVASCLIFSIASKSKLFHFRTKSNSMWYLNRFLACPVIPRFSNRRYQLLEVKRGRALCPLQVPLSVAQLRLLLCAARSLPIHHSLPIICKSHVVSYLLPFVVANIGVVAESDPKVKCLFYLPNFSWITNLHSILFNSYLRMLYKSLSSSEFCCLTSPRFAWLTFCRPKKEETYLMKTLV